MIRFRLDYTQEKKEELQQSETNKRDLVNFYYLEVSDRLAEKCAYRVIQHYREFKSNSKIFSIFYFKRLTDGNIFLILEALWEKDIREIFKGKYKIYLLEKEKLKSYIKNIVTLKEEDFKIQKDQVVSIKKLPSVLLKIVEYKNDQNITVSTINTPKILTFVITKNDLKYERNF